MPDVTISYKGNSIATMSASGTKTLLTEGKYCEDDITVAYTKPSAPSPSLQAKTNINPTTSSQTITADQGYDGLSSVQINAMPSGSAATPATTITVSPSASVVDNGANALIYATVSATQSITPSVSAGYVASGTAGTVTVSGSSTSILPSKAAATYTPTTTDQTIAYGQYLIGAQTIKGDANLLAENIKKDVSIFSIVGSYEGGGGGGVQTANVTIANNDADYLYYTDANMTVHSVTSGNRDLNGVPIPIGSLVVCVRSALAPPIPITTACLNEIASYTVGSKGIVRIYEVFDEFA